MTPGAVQGTALEEHCGADAGTVVDTKALNIEYGEVMMTFAPYGMTPQEALRCWKRWGAAAVRTIRDNPYLLCTPGLYIGFERADAICRAMNGAADDPHRVEAGILYVLRHNLGNGHTCLPADKLVPTTASLLGLEAQRVDACPHHRRADLS